MAIILDASPVEASRASSTVLAAMSFLDKLERRFGFLAIPGLIRIVVMFTALVCVLAYIDQHFISVLDLKPALIKRGQVWRLVTYIFIPTSPLQQGSMLSPLLAVVALWFLWWFGAEVHARRG